ncbi:hypothetical protein BQ8482_110716 [Mesorhizobium delmotii]|uniref:Uncharacterized protein n=1 Tax=Mesorhizobium delmotii TaxID=1631247 RepID=A0A2P9ACD7_9HYPH|nr:hypothetical protein BQ8482_110716 [Mesorhizobium delmotii]
MPIIVMALPFTPDPPKCSLLSFVFGRTLPGDSEQLETSLIRIGAIVASGYRTLGPFSAISVNLSERHLLWVEIHQASTFPARRHVVGYPTVDAARSNRQFSGTSSSGFCEMLRHLICDGVATVSARVPVPVIGLVKT